MDIEEVRKTLAGKRQDFESLGVEALFLFGSSLSKPISEVNDLDIIVDFEHEKLSFNSFFESQYLLELIFKKKIDLMTRASIDISIKEKIVKDMVNIF